METFRISKYDPKYRDSNGHYQRDEWTAISDIGEIYNNLKFTKEEYLTVENSYVNTVKEFIVSLKLRSLFIKDLTKLELLLSVNYSSLYDDNMIAFRKKTSENQEITILCLDTLIRLLLREDISCLLVDKYHQLEIELGYDFYIYIRTDNANKEILEELCHKNGLFLEDSGFPISFEYIE